MDISSTQKSLGPVVSPSPARASSDETAKAVSLVAKSDAAESAAKTTQEASREQIEGAITTIQDFVQSVQRSINFALDDSSGRVVVKVTDADSGDVIRQIPSEEALQMAENLSEVRSLLFKAEA